MVDARLARRRAKRPVTSAKVWVLLTAAQTQKLQELAEADFRAVGSYVSWLVAQELERPSRRRPVKVAARGQRLSVSIALRMPPEMLRCLYL